MKAEDFRRNGSDRRPLKELTAAGTAPGFHRLPFSNERDAAQQALAAPIHRNPTQKYKEAKKIANQTPSSCKFQNYCYLCSPQTLWCVGRVARHRSAKPTTAVRFLYAPHSKAGLVAGFLREVRGWPANPFGRFNPCPSDIPFQGNTAFASLPAGDSAASMSSTSR